MSDEQVAARDTTFDNVIPKSVWICTRTTEDRKYIKLILSINGIEKELDRIYVGSYDGILSSSHQITWVINSAYDALAKENEELKAKTNQMSDVIEEYVNQVNSLRASLKEAVEALEIYAKQNCHPSILEVAPRFRTPAIEAIAKIKAKHGEL